MKTLKQLMYLLSFNESKNVKFLLIMITAMAILDTIGVASILPFMAVLTNPNLIETNVILNSIFQTSVIFGVKTDQQFQFILGLFVFLFLVFSLFFKALTTFMQIRFVQMNEYNISKRLVEGYLKQPYEWFLNRHSADLGKTILSEVQQVVFRGMNSLIEFIARSVVTLGLLILLIIVDIQLALIVGILLGGSYAIVFYFVRKILIQFGRKNLKNNLARYTTVNEAFGGIKQIKVSGLEEIYVKNFSNYAYNYAKVQSCSLLISILPRYVLEIIAFGGILIIILYNIFQKGNFENSLPIISLFVFSGYRLMPALQQIYSSITQLSFIGPSLQNLSFEFKNYKTLNIINQNKNVIFFDKKITLKNVKYNYPNSSKIILKNINLNIPAKSNVGIVGTTGSGKSTLIDIILGLLEPQNGILEVDGTIITKINARSWQQTIGYVSQHIYLCDDTVLKNIAFGIEEKNINIETVRKVAKIANIHNFIINECPKKYQTKIGEQGIRLSGGQRQRIGIARALYNNPKVLILDEATSALDNKTEKAVMDSINNLRKNMTIIIIAHRLNTVKNSDIIYEIEHGRIVSKKNFKDFIKKNKIINYN